jgi:hypothetical protein
MVNSLFVYQTIAETAVFESAPVKVAGPAPKNLSNLHLFPSLALGP